VQRELENFSIPPMETFSIAGILPLTDEQYQILEDNDIDYYLGMDNDIEFDSKEDYEKAKKLLKID
jgi:hypothetical protein